MATLQGQTGPTPPGEVSARDVGRSRRYVAALGSAYALLATNVLLYAVSAPWFLQRLGVVEFGFWLVLQQLVYVVTLVTTWIATPLVRESAACYVRGDHDGLNRTFHTTARYYAAIAAASLVVVMITLPFVPGLFRLPPESVDVGADAFLIVAVYAAGWLQLNLLLSVLSGYQLMHVANMVLLAQTALGVALGVAAVSVGQGVRGLAAGQLVALSLMYAVAIGVLRRRVRIPRRTGSFDRDLLRRLIRSGTGYFGYSVSYLLLQSDLVLIGVALGPAAAATYGIAYKLADYAIQMIWRMPDALLPSIAELQARGDLDSLATTYRASAKLSTAAGVLAAVLIAGLGRATIDLWFGGEYSPAQPLFVALAVFVILQAIVHSAVVIPYGAGQMRPLARVALVEGALKVSIALLLLSRVGIIGAVVASIVAQVALTGWYAPRIACRITALSGSAFVRSTILPVLPAAGVAALIWTLARSIHPSDWGRLVAVAGVVSAGYGLVYLRTAVSRGELAILTALVRRAAFVR